MAAAAVIALISAAGAAWDATRHDTAPARPVETSLPAHEGYRWVGMNGIALEVPASWTTFDSGCAPNAVDSVVFDEHLKLPCLAQRIDPKASSLHLETLDSRNFIAEIAPPSEEHRISVGGVQALVTDPVELNCPSGTHSSCVPVYGVSIEVPSMNLLAWAESPTAAIAADTIASATPIPDGYVAVPAVNDLAQAHAATLIGKRGLSPESMCPSGGHVCDGDLAVRRTDPVAGTVVAAGARVSIELSWVTVSGD
jgi:hypothetical protein